MIEQRTAIAFPSAQPERRNVWKMISRSILGGLMLSFMLLALPGVAVAAKPIIDTSYANDKIVYMIGPHLITNPNPNQFAQAEELYIVAYPINPSGNDTVPKSLDSGYSPQCNPCYHFGPNDVFAYHDHILSGAPGFGKHGTAGDFKGPWRIILVMYTEDAIKGDFAPATNATELDRRESQEMFQVINPGAANPYEIELPVILICPLVAPDA